MTARDLKADGAMAALLEDAIKPNLVQTLEGNPAFVHGGPFANIAHGCNSVVATRAALALGDYVVTEAGFGADLGAEKFFDIKCRAGGAGARAAVVIVATVRALKMHGGVAKADSAARTWPRSSADRSISCATSRTSAASACRSSSRSTISTATPPPRLAAIQPLAAAHGVDAIVCRHWADGGAGAADLAERSPRWPSSRRRVRPALPRPAAAVRQDRTVASASTALPRSTPRRRCARNSPGGRRPASAICRSAWRRRSSFSTDPTRLGAPRATSLTVREVRLAAGAGFVVAVCGDIMTMPGLPRDPAANGIGLDADGEVVGLS